VQAPAGAVAVLGQVIGVKLGKAVESIEVFDCSRPFDCCAAEQMFGGELI